VYISDIRRAKEKLGWAPTVAPAEGVRNLLDWLKEGALAQREA
jgi:nucleoside-diphosphate-sugar epimerase